MKTRWYHKIEVPITKCQQLNPSYINAEIWLHGSCAAITEGLCGDWNGNRDDDLFQNNPNAHGEKFEEYDEDCPAPPPPYDPCEVLGSDDKAQAKAICNRLLGRYLK